MGFKEVFESLKEAFPQADFRLLKAIALEHSNDVDAAAEFVIAEVLSIGEPKKAQGPSGMMDLSYAGSSGTTDSPVTAFSGTKDSPIVVESHEEDNDAQLARSKRPILPDYLAGTYEDKADQSDVLVDIPDDSNVPDSTREQVTLMEITGVTKEFDVEQFVGQTSINSIVDNADLHQKLPTESADSDIDVFINEFALNTVSDMQMAQPSNAVVEEVNAADFSSSHASSNFYSGNNANNINTEENLLLLHSEKNLLEDRSTNDEDRKVSLVSFQTANCQDFITLEDAGPSIDANAALDQTVMLSRGNMLDSSENSDDVRYLTSNTVDACDKQQLVFLNEKSTDLLPNEDELLSSHENDQSSTTDGQSSNFVGIEFLESFLADVKNNKENLVSSVDSIINLMADVTLLEENAKQATEEASNAGQEIFSKVEELKKTLKHAKEQNDMMSGEVYGERAVLATEARELQSRLFNLSDERNKALLMVEQIHEALKLRIVAAEVEIAASERVKLEKEALALASLEEQELIMEFIVEESKKLHQEAEENSKLREFLMDRGRLVDTLQGEIAVICEDVLALKERVASGLPLNKLSQSTASSLASSLSLSSVRSRSSTDVVAQTVDADKLPTAGVDESQTATQLDDLQPEDKICLDDQKEPADDEWEVFDMLSFN